MKRTTLHDAYAGIGRGVKSLQKENEELRARITALETAGRVVVKRRDVGDLLKAIDALATLLGETK